MLKKQPLPAKAFLQELTWQQARSQVMSVNPELAKAIDDVDPSNQYTLFKLTCPYGTEILKMGKLYLPNQEGEMVSISDASISEHVKEALSYNLGSNPVTLVLKNTVELFLNLEDRIVPLYGVVSAGKLFGLWRVLNPHTSHQSDFIWYMTAGARSVFMLPKIAEAERHKRLKKIYQLGADIPRTLLDHWDIFREIANHPSFSQKWIAELLFFSNKWFKQLNDKAWLNFNYYLYRSAWIGSEFWRNNFFWDLMFSIIQKRKSIKPSPYTADSVKYLLAIGVGASPGFSPAIDSSLLPLHGIQAAYINDYNLKEYPPIIMQPSVFSFSQGGARPVYYSLPFPNAIDFSLKSRNRTSLITDLFEIKSLMTKYLDEISNGRLNVESTPLFELTRKVKFDYFHNNVEMYGGIRDSSEIPKEDPNFFKSVKNCSGKEFPATATFVKGCIRLTEKD